MPSRSISVHLPFVVALDGPAGAGKSTIAKNLANEINVAYIDSGSIYRTLTYIGLTTFQSIEGFEDQIAAIFNTNLEALRIIYTNQQQEIYWNNTLLGEELHSLALTKQIKWVANHAACRDIVNQKIRHIALTYPVVIDGRDIGSIVFPNTPYKFYLDASLEERTRRRAAEKNIAENTEAFFDLQNNIAQRDHTDQTRSIAPLKQADDAVYLDTSSLSINQVVQSLVASIIQKQKD